MPKTWTDTAEEDLQQEASVFDRLSPQHLLTAIFIKYFLRDGELTPSDFRSSFTDGANDGGIDAVSRYEQDEAERIALVQSKRVATIDRDEILDIAHKIATTITDFDEGRGAKYSNRLRRAYETARSSTENAPLDIHICTTAVPTPAAKDTIREALRQNKKLKDYSIYVFYGNDIEDAIENIDQPKENVEEDYVEADSASNTLEYYLPAEDNPKGLIVNVCASSISRLYTLYNDKGLFAQNLRSYIPSKKVDDAIIDTIRNSPDEFWLKNNGLTIACSDYRKDGNRVVLYDFSIINGCQTATKIGNADIPKDDFHMPCKVIRETDKARMAVFAEAANAQKPIQERDLKSNSPEQLALKSRLEKHDPPIYLGIKRGSKMFSKAQRRNREIREWQQLDNRLYGQLVLACHRQKPYVSFSQGGTIFSSNETYKEVFLRQTDFDTDIDILRLHDVYLSWRDEFVESGVLEIQEAIVTQGRFSILANCALLIKMERDLVDVDARHNKEDWKREFVRGELAGPLLKDGGNKDLTDEAISGLRDLFAVLLELHQSVVEAENVGRLYKNEDFYVSSLTPQLVFRRQTSPFERYYSEPMEQALC